MQITGTKAAIAAVVDVRLDEDYKLIVVEGDGEDEGSDDEG